MSPPCPSMIAYQGLESWQQKILQVLAVFAFPTPEPILREVLEDLEWTGGRGQPLAAMLGPRRLMPLRSQGLLQGFGMMLSCCPELVSPLTRKLAEEELLEEAVAVVEGCFRSHRGGFFLGSLQVDPEQVRLMRLHHALQLRDHAVLPELLGLPDLDPWEYLVTSGTFQVLERFLEHVPSPQDLASLPALVRFQLLVISLRERLLEMLPREESDPEWERQLALLVEKNPQGGWALAELRLHRGLVDEETERLLEGATGYRALTNRGWLRLLQGKPAEALEDFEAAVKLRSRRIRKRKTCLVGLPAVLHLMALLILGQRSHLQRLAELARLAWDLGSHEGLRALFPPFWETAGILLGTTPQEEVTFLQAPGARLEAAPHGEVWGCLFRALLLRWLGMRSGADALSGLRQLLPRVEGAGAGWFLRECQDLLGEDPSVGSGELRSLASQLQPRQLWEVALQALDDLGQGLEKPEGAPLEKSDRRLVWRLTIYEGAAELSPYEQKRTRRGWSKGRRVAVKALLRPQDLDYLTPEDLPLVACVKTEVEGRYYGRFRETIHFLDPREALLAAIGHPRIYLAENPEVRVELVREEPVLLVSRSGKGLRLELQPECPRARDLLIREAGPDRMAVVEFSPPLLKIASILGREGLEVPETAREQVLGTVSALAPLLTIHSEIGGGDAARSVPPNLHLYVHLQPVGEGLAADCFVKPFGPDGPGFRPGQGGGAVFAEISGERLHTDRDLPGESSWMARLEEACPALENRGGFSWTLEDPEQALQGLLELQGLAPEVVLEWPRGKPLRLCREVSMGDMKVHLKSQKDWFSLDGELTLDGDRVLSMRQLLELLEASPGRFLRLGEGEFLALTRDLRQRLDRLRALAGGGRLHPLSIPAVEEVTEGMAVKTVKAWRERAARIREAMELEPELPSTLQADLRDYQLDGFRWMARLSHWGAGACLADDMGLGKTLQALAVILTRAPQGPTLVLAPTSVCTGWLEEAARFAPTLRPLRFGPGDRRAQLESLGPFDLVVCSYGLLQTEAKALSGVEWQTLVADEAQAIKNHNTQRARAAMTLKAGFRILTTGTPIENHLGELWTLFRFLNPGLLGTREKFDQRFAIPIEQYQDATARQTLRGLVRPFLLRRRKSEVLQELPARTEITVHVEFSPEERIFYEALRQRALERFEEGDDGSGQTRFKILAEIMRLRRACCHPRLVLPESPLESSKLLVFAEILEELRENRHKALVFSQFVGHLARIREYLDGQGIAYQYLDGSTSVKDRKRAVDAFQAGEGDLFLISLKAGGSGLNLTAADYVLHMDPWWNPAVEDQASDRAHRIGQLRPVTIYRLVVRDTIEEKIVELHRTKRDLADGLLEGSEQTGKLSTEEILALLRDAP